MGSADSQSHFYRQTRQKTGLKSVLDDIDGIGNKRKHYYYVHSVQSRKMKEAT